MKTWQSEPSKRFSGLVRICATSVPFLLFTAVVYCAIGPEDFEARSFTGSKGRTLVYRLFIPRDYDSSKQYPIVTFLHGRGRKGTDNLRQMSTPGATLWAQPEVQAAYPCFVFVPQSPEDDGWRVRDSSGGARISALETVEEIWDALEREFSIDFSRRYISAQSGGGGGAWPAMIRKPDRFAAAAIVCAGITWNSSEMAEIATKLKDMPLWLFHGRDDPLVPVSRSREKIEALRAAGGSPRYSEYAGVGHDSWGNAFAESDLPTWLFSQTRNTEPQQDPASDVRADIFESRIYENARGDELPYRLFIPKDYEAGKKYPLVLFLHGGGERGKDNRAQMRQGGSRLWAAAEIQDRWPCFVVAPQCPKNDYWGVREMRGTSREDRSLGEPREFCPIRSVWGILDSLEKEFSIDTDREYLTGLSMGGRGTWESLMHQPYRFAAAIVICPGIRPAPETIIRTLAKTVTQVPIWLFHGTNDQIVPVQHSRDTIEALRAAGGSPRYMEYPGVLHNSWLNAYSEPGLADWLFVQRRARRANQ